MGEIKASLILTRFISEGCHGQRAEQEKRQQIRNSVAWRGPGILRNRLARGVGLQTGWQTEGNMQPLELAFLIEATLHGDGNSPVERKKFGIWVKWG